MRHLAFFLSFSCACLFASEQVQVFFPSMDYKDNRWVTQKGGIVKSKGLYVQAKNITYTPRDDKQHSLEAEGHVLVIYQGRFFKAKRFEYDFLTQKGTLEEGKGKYQLWYASAKTLTFHPDHSVNMEDAEISSCPQEFSEWGLKTRSIQVFTDSILSGQHLFLHLLKTPIFYLPYFKLDVENLKGIPIKNRIHFRGTRGTSLNFKYRFFSSEKISTFLRLDYNFKGKAGIGLDTNYHCKKSQTYFSSKNFITQENFTSLPKESKRYRLEGDFSKQIYEDTTGLTFQYDRLSDANVLLEENDSFTHISPKKTELALYHLHPASTFNFYIRKRINAFETVKEELPTLEGNFRPFKIGSLFASSFFKISYLNFLFSENTQPSRTSSTLSNDFSSLRTVLKQEFFKSFFLPYLSITPRAKLTAIFYSNAPKRRNLWILSKQGSYKVQSDWHKNSPTYTHYFSPFFEHHLFSKPSTAITQHYIFDHDDTLSYLNRLRVGAENRLSPSSGLFPRLQLALYTHFFPNNPNFPHKNPHYFLEGHYQPNPKTSHLFKWVWNRAHRQSDFYHYRFLSSLSKKLTLKAEYSHRGPYYWRKSDHSSYFLEAIHDEDTLLNSAVSFPRKTLLTTLHYQLSPLDSVSFTTRLAMDMQGKYRSFKEYKIEYETLIRCNWAFKVAYEKTMIESHRFSLALNLLDYLPPKLQSSSKALAF